MKTLSKIKNIFIILSMGLLVSGCASTSKSTPSISNPTTTSKHVHSYVETITVEPGCTTPGEKIFTCECGDVKREPIPPLGHDYGNLIPEVLPTYYQDGRKAHYICSRCKKYFDERKNEVTFDDLFLQHIQNDEIALSINNRQVGSFIQTEKNQSQIRYKYENVQVNKDDYVTITKPNYPSYRYGYTPSGNLTENYKIITAGTVNFEVLISNERITLTVSGYKYPGYVLKINNHEHPFNNVNYCYSDVKTNIYGFENINVGDQVTIVDNTTNKVYNFEDLDDSCKWNSFDFHKGNNGEIVFDTAGCYGFEFSRNGDKRLYITKTFSPKTTSSIKLQFEGNVKQPITFEHTTLTTSSEEYKQLSWFINNDKVNNNGTIKSYISSNGFDYYCSTIFFKENDKFNLLQNTNETIGSNHLSSLTTKEQDVLTLEGNYIKFLRDGNYKVMYVPCTNTIMLAQESSENADAYLLVDNSYIELFKDANSKVTYKNLHRNTGESVTFLDKNRAVINVSLDDELSNVAHTYYGNNLTIICFDKAATYNLVLDLTTLVVTMTYKLDEEDIEYSYDLRIESLSTSETTTIAMAISDEDAYIEGIYISTNTLISVIKTNKNDSSDIETIYSLSEENSESIFIRMYLGEYPLITVDGEYNFRYSFTTERITISEYIFQ